MGRRWTKCKRLLCPLCFLVFLSSCSGTSDNETKPPPPAPKYTVYTVEIKNMKFSPDSLVVKTGDEVVFVNRDLVDHCVTEVKNKTWTSGVLPAGQSYLLVAKESSDYYCAIHKVMTGKIIVQ